MSAGNNGVPTGPAPPVEAPGILIGSLYVEFHANPAGREITPKMLGHIPDAAARACAEILERIAANLKARGSRIIRPLP